MVARGEFLEYAQVFGKNWYGTPRKWLDEALAQQKDLVLEIDVQGALQVKGKLPRCRRHFRSAAVARRISKSASGNAARIPKMKFARRLERARQEIQNYTRYDFAIINDDLERAGREVQAIALGFALPHGAKRRTDSRDSEVLWRLILMTVSRQAPDSQFAYVVVVARRARQLMMGGRPLCG